MQKKLGAEPIASCAAKQSCAVSCGHMMLAHFCARPNCTLDAALQSMGRHAFVGLVEHFHQSLMLLEAVLPSYFGGIVDAYAAGIDAAKSSSSSFFLWPLLERLLGRSSRASSAMNRVANNVGNQPNVFDRTTTRKIAQRFGARALELDAELYRHTSHQFWAQYQRCVLAPERRRAAKLSP